jgi:hypothetical protein
MDICNNIRTGRLPYFESVNSAFDNNGPLKSSVGQIDCLHMVLVIKTVKTPMDICNNIRTGHLSYFESVNSVLDSNSPLKSSVGQIELVWSAWQIDSLHMVLFLKETSKAPMDICISKGTGCLPYFESVNSVFDNKGTKNCSVRQIDSLYMLLVLKETVKTPMDICKSSKTGYLPYFESVNSVFDN